MQEGCVASVVGAGVHAGLWFPPQQTLAIWAGFPERIPRN